MKRLFYLLVFGALLWGGGFSSKLGIRMQRTTQGYTLYKPEDTLWIEEDTMSSFDKRDIKLQVLWDGGSQTINNFTYLSTEDIRNFISLNFSFPFKKLCSFSLRNETEGEFFFKKSEESYRKNYLRELLSISVEKKWTENFNIAFENILKSEFYQNPTGFLYNTISGQIGPELNLQMGFNGFLTAKYDFKKEVAPDTQDLSYLSHNFSTSLNYLTSEKQVSLSNYTEIRKYNNPFSDFVLEDFSGDISSNNIGLEISYNLMNYLKTDAKSYDNTNLKIGLGPIFDIGNAWAFEFMPFYSIYNAYLPQNYEDYRELYFKASLNFFSYKTFYLMVENKIGRRRYINPDNIGNSNYRFYDLIFWGRLTFLSRVSFDTFVNFIKEWHTNAGDDTELFLYTLELNFIF